MIPIDERLRETLAARAASVHPTERLAAIERQVALVRRRRRVTWAAAGVGVAVAAVLGVLALRPDADRDVTVVTGTPTTTAAPDLSTSAATTAAPDLTAPTTVALPGTTVPPTSAAPGTTPPVATTVVDPPAVVQPPVWPAPGAEPFASPAEAALSMARDLLAFPPSVGVESTSLERPDGVEVVLRAFGDRGVRTRVFTRRSGPGWVVERAESENVLVDEPAVWAGVSLTMDLRGRSATFEATLTAEARALGSTTPLAEPVVLMGGSGLSPEPFSGQLTLPADAPDVVVLVFREPDMSGEGDVVSATVFAVRVVR